MFGALKKKHTKWMKADLKDETRSKHHAAKILFALLQQRLAEHEFVLRRARVIDELEKCLFFSGMPRALFVL